MIPYLLTVALHSAALSIFASAALLVVRQARHRAVISICGLLAVAILPWITALRPAPVPVVASRKIPVAPSTTALPVWTVVTLPAEIPATVKCVKPPAAAPAAVAFPDPLKSSIVLWGLGSAAGLLLLGIAWLRQRHWRNSLEAIDDDSWARLRETCFPLPDRKTFLLTAFTASLCVSGFRHPHIVLPRFLFADDSSTALGWAVRHELSHLRAGDSRWMLVLSLVRCLHGWNPFVHHLVSRWAAAREQLCDLAAADTSGTRGDYGKFLVAMAGQINHRSPLTVAMARRAPARRLKSRIVSLLDAEPGAAKPVGKSFIGLSLIGSVAVGVMVSVLSIRAEEAAVEKDPAVPSLVQEQPPESLPESKPSMIPESATAESAALTKDWKPTQLKISTKFIATMGKSPIPDGAILNVTGLKQAMRQFAESKGTYLMTAPNLTARFGQNAPIEIIREIARTRDQISAKKPDTAAPFVGMKIGLDSELKDGRVELDTSVDYRFIPGFYQPIHDGPSGNAIRDGANLDDIKILERKASARLESGMTLVADIGEIEPGTFLLMFVTVQSIDAAGRPTAGFTDSTVLPLESGPSASIQAIIPSAAYGLKPSRADDPPPTSKVIGKLKLSGNYVEFPAREGAEIPQEPLIQLVPLSSEISQSILSQSGLKLRKLKAVEISLNEVATPWAEFPGLKLTAMSSSDFKRITVSSLPVGEGDKLEGLSNMWRDLTNGSVMNFSLKSPDPKLERRLIVRLEAVK